MCVHSRQVPEAVRSTCPFLSAPAQRCSKRYCPSCFQAKACGGFKVKVRGQEPFQKQLCVQQWDPAVTYQRSPLMLWLPTHTINKRLASTKQHPSCPVNGGCIKPHPGSMKEHTTFSTVCNIPAYALHSLEPYKRAHEDDRGAVWIVE